MALPIPLTLLKRCGRLWTSEFFAASISSSVTGRAPRMPLISFMNSVRAASLLAVMMSPPAWNGPGPRPNWKSDPTP